MEGCDRGLGGLLFGEGIWAGLNVGRDEDLNEGLGECGIIMVVKVKRGMHK